MQNSSSTFCRQQGFARSLGVDANKASSLPAAFLRRSGSSAASLAPQICAVETVVSSHSTGCVSSGSLKINSMLDFQNSLDS